MESDDKVEGNRGLRRPRLEPVRRAVARSEPWQLAAYVVTFLLSEVLVTVFPAFSPGCLIGLAIAVILSRDLEFASRESGEGLSLKSGDARASGAAQGSSVSRNWKYWFWSLLSAAPVSFGLVVPIGFLVDRSLVRAALPVVIIWLVFVFGRTQRARFLLGLGAFLLCPAIIVIVLLFLGFLESISTLVENVSRTDALIIAGAVIGCAVLMGLGVKFAKSGRSQRDDREGR